MGMFELVVWGRFKYPSSEHAYEKDACAILAVDSTILGLAALGEAADAMAGLRFCALYHN